MLHMMSLLQGHHLLDQSIRDCIASRAHPLQFGAFMSHKLLVSHPFNFVLSRSGKCLQHFIWAQLIDLLNVWMIHMNPI